MKDALKENALIDQRQETISLIDNTVTRSLSNERIDWTQAHLGSKAWTPLINVWSTVFVRFLFHIHENSDTRENILVNSHIINIQFQ